MADEKSGSKKDEKSGRKKEERLRGVVERLEDEQRSWNGDLDASNRREIDEFYNDARGDRSSLAWGAGGMQREDRSDSITAVVSENNEERGVSAEEAEGPAAARERHGDASEKNPRKPDREGP